MAEVTCEAAASLKPTIARLLRVIGGQKADQPDGGVPHKNIRLHPITKKVRLAFNQAYLSLLFPSAAFSHRHLTLIVIPWCSFRVLRKRLIILICFLFLLRQQCIKVHSSLPFHRITRYLFHASPSNFLLQNGVNSDFPQSRKCLHPRSYSQVFIHYNDMNAFLICRHLAADYRVTPTNSLR